MNLLTVVPEDLSAGTLAVDALITVLIGFTVVFLMLLLLTGVFKVFGLIMTYIEKNSKAASQPDFYAEVPTPAPVSAAAPAVGNTETVASKPDVDGGVPAETVAAISAAVASVAPAGTQYAVKGIRKL